ncbi:MAG: hypothetical protein ISP90_17435 [Nevskia sp.]|nr:hypothetical protein [Nevskia sp.]
MRIVRLACLLAAAVLLDNCSSSAGLSGSGNSGGPISAAADTWTWVGFDDAYCANGTTTGIGVNLHPGASRLLIYMEGGGACWDENTCYVADTAVNIANGYGAANFQVESASTGFLSGPGGYFDRGDAANPFRDYSYVYVPYCTGDVHAGANVAQYGTHATRHVGFTNMTAYLKRIVPTVPGVQRVVISGSSAGGFGATFNLWQTQQAFGNVRVDLINDSGTPLPADVMALGNGAEALWRANWDLAATLPAGCSGCATDLSAIFGYYAAALPGSRIGLLSYAQDTVLPVYFGITTAEFTAGLNEMLANQFLPYANLQYFEAGGAGHVLWFVPLLATGAVTDEAFITQMEADDPAWTSVHP